MKRIKFLHHIVYVSILSFLVCGCGTHNKTRKDIESDLIEHQVLTSHLSKKQKKLIEEAKTWLGTPYKYAGVEKNRGVDCSGLVMKTYLSSVEVSLPRNSAKQAEYCRKLKKKDVRPGDLVFFATGKDAKKVTHVGIMIDADGFIHASSSKGVVISYLSNPWYAERFLMFGRVPKMD